MKLLRSLPLVLLGTAFALAQMPPVKSDDTTKPAASTAKATTIFIVRHAEKAGASGDVELSEVGEKRAACLAGALSGAKLDAIYTTEYKRTKNTAAPAAARSGVAPTVISGADMNGLIAALKKAEGQTVLVVGHSNTVPAIIERLGGPKFTIKDEEYDHLYVVTLIHGQASVASLRYCQ